MHLIAIKRKQSEVIYTYRLTTKQIFICIVMFFLWNVAIKVVGFFICSYSHHVHTIFHFFEICGWTIQEQQPFWRKIQFAVKVFANNSHQTLLSQHTVAHFVRNRQQIWIFLIGYKTTVLELDKVIYVTFSTESSH